jgi:hypothetical protein
MTQNKEVMKLDELGRIISLAKSIPYMCGKEDCHSPGCSAIRELRQIAVDIEMRIRNYFPEEYANGVVPKSS